MRIVSVVGARPNFVKCAPLSKELRKSHEEIIIHTGQHYDYEMDKIFFDQLGIPEPDYNLGVGSGSHGYQTGEMIKRMEEILMKTKPDIVIAYGDTNSTLAGALAAAKLNIKVGHVEAGLRCYDKSMPEEINRVLTDHCSDLLFCPTENAVKNLKKEGIEDGVYITGDVMVDAMKNNVKIAEEKSKILNDLSIESKEYYLATVHRNLNTDNYIRLKSIVEAFCELGNIVFPCHLRTEKMLKKYNLWDKITKNIRVIKPVGYLDMLVLEKNALKILTDSGGIQKEAYLLNVPCITLRDKTEWVETVEDGWNVLVGANKRKIIKAASDFEPTRGQSNIFGDGDASRKITDIIINFMKRGRKR